MSLYDTLALFLVYSLLGWCVEVIYAALTTGKVINRGFLNGPVCPIYGFGMIGVLTLLAPFSNNLPILFITGLLLCSLIELVGGWALEKFFHTRWWDYSMRPLNIGGYVCLGFSIVWGIAVVFVVRLIHPMLLTTVDIVPAVLPGFLVWILIGVGYFLFLVDFGITLQTIIGLQKKLAELEKIGAALHRVSEGMSNRLGNSAIHADARIDELKEAGSAKLEAEKAELQANIAALEAQKARLEESITQQRKRIADSASQRVQKAGEALISGREQLGENLSEALARLESQLQQVENRLLDLHKIRTHTAAEAVDSTPDWTARLHSLEKRRAELIASMNAPRFGTRRLAKAFPALRSGIRSRMDRVSEAISEHLEHMDS